MVDSPLLWGIGVYPTPWPAFCVAARTDLMRDNQRLLRRLWATAGERGRTLMDDPALPELAARRYGLASPEATEWSQQVRWTDPGAPTDLSALQQVCEAMHALGRVDRRLDPRELMQA